MDRNDCLAVRAGQQQQQLQLLQLVYNCCWQLWVNHKSAGSNNNNNHLAGTFAFFSLSISLSLFASFLFILCFRFSSVIIAQWKMTKTLAHWVRKRLPRHSPFTSLPSLSLLPLPLPFFCSCLLWLSCAFCVSIACSTTLDSVLQVQVQQGMSRG